MRHAKRWMVSGMVRCWKDDGVHRLRSVACAAACETEELSRSLAHLMSKVSYKSTAYQLARARRPHQPLSNSRVKFDI